MAALLSRPCFPSVRKLKLKLDLLGTIPCFLMSVIIGCIVNCKLIVTKVFKAQLIVELQAFLQAFISHHLSVCLFVNLYDAIERIVSNRSASKKAHPKDFDLKKPNAS